MCIVIMIHNEEGVHNTRKKQSTPNNYYRIINVLSQLYIETTIAIVTLAINQAKNRI